MKQLVIVVATLAATAGTARAGGYLSLGVGADASLSGDMAQHFTTETADESSGRIALGQRMGRFALEVQLYGADVDSVTALGARQSYSTATLGVGAKYYIPLTGRLEGYGKAGLDKTWLVGQGDNPEVSYSGRGYNLGGGLQLTFEAVLMGSIAFWLDYTHQSFELHDDVKRDLEGGTQLLTVGVSLGF